MSEPNPPTDPVASSKPGQAEKSPSDKPASDKPPMSRGRKWRRRIIAFLLIVIAGAFLVRAAVPLLLPPVLTRVAGTFGLKAEYDDLDLYAFGGDVGLWNLRFTPIAGGEPVLRMGYCRASIVPMALLRGKLDVRRVEADDAAIFLERAADGTIPLLEQLLASQSADPAPSRSTEESQPISLEPPFHIDVVRLQNARAHIRDLGVTPATDVSFYMDLMALGLSPEGPPAEFEVQVRSPEALAALYVNGRVTGRASEAMVDFDARMHGLDLRAAQAYLSPFGIYPTARDLTGRAKGRLAVQLLSGGATTQPSAQPADTKPSFALQLSLDDIELTADTKSAASVKRVSVDVPALSANAVRVAEVRVDTVRVNAQRTREGRLSFAGIELASPDSSASPSTQPAAVQPAESAAMPATQRSQLPMAELVKLSVHDAQLTFLDEAMGEPIHLALRVPEVTLANLSTDPAATQPATLDARASADGVFADAHVKGRAALASAMKTIDLSINARGVAPTVLAPYMTLLGLQSDLQSADFACTLSAGVDVSDPRQIRAQLRAHDLTFVDQGRPLLTLKNADLRDLIVATDLSRIRLGDVAVEGPTLPLTLAQDGAIGTLGLRYTPVSAAATTTAASAPAATQPTTAVAINTGSAAGGLKLPVVEIGKLRWRGAGLSLFDLRTEKPLELETQDVQLDIDDVRFDAAATSAKPGTMRFSVGAPGIVKTFRVDATVAPTGEAIGIQFSGAGEGITVEKLKDVLAAFGVVPVLRDGTVQFSGFAGAWQKDGSIGLDLGLSECALVDGDTRWLSLGHVYVNGVTFDGKTASVNWIDVSKPVAYVSRDEQGRLSLAGVRLEPVPAAAATVPAGQPKQASPTRVDLSLPVIIKLGGLNVVDAALRLHDAAVAPAADLSLRADLGTSPITLGEPAKPTTFDVSFGSPGVLESGRASGSFLLAPAEQSIQLSASGTGLSVAPLEPYLPPNIKGRFEGGTFAAKLAASLRPNEQGGSVFDFTLEDAALRETANGNPVAGVKSVRVKANRVDLPGKVIDIDELSVAGAQLAVAQDAQGVSAFGVTIGARPFRSVAPAAPSAPTPATTEASDVAALMTLGQEKPPLITIKTLSLGADRLSLSTPALGRELAVVGASLTNASPIALLGSTPERHPPTELKLQATVEQLVQQIAASATLAPFAREPQASASVRISGIRGEELTNFLPQLKNLLDGSDLSDGAFTADAEARFNYARRGAIGVDLTRDITADVVIKDVRLTRPGEDKPLAGLDELRIDRVRYVPATGSVIASVVELTNPQARILRDAAGLHALGLTLKLDGGDPAATESSAAEPAAAPTPAEAPAPASEPARASAAEYRIEQFRISGISLEVEDRVGDVPTYLPINSLDVDVKGLTSRALEEPKPIRFSAIVGGGKVPLPPRGRGADVDVTEERPLFSEASATGDLVLVPLPKGFVKLSMSGLEMRALRGLTRQYKVDVTGGTFDVRCDVRMEGGNTFSAKIFPTLNEVRATEPPGGPVQSALQLSVPLDAAIGLLESADGSITFPVVAPIEAGNIRYGPIMGSVLGSVGRVVAEAIVSSPVKALGLLTGEGSQRLEGIEPVVITFAPGETQIGPDQSAALQAMLDRMKKDPSLKVTLEHTLGASDVALATQRANPPREDAGALAARYREQKARLQSALVEEVAKVRVAVASQSSQQAEQAVAALRNVSAELAATDANLELLLELQRPGAERYSERRTKAAAVVIGTQRLQAVQTHLDAVGVPAEKLTIKPARFAPSEEELGTVRCVLNREAKN